MNNTRQRRRRVLSMAEFLINTGCGVVPIHGVIDGRCQCRDGPQCKTAGKHPISKLAPRGCNSPVTALSVIRKALKSNPHLNLAVATGGDAGLVVLDLDERHGGLKSWRILDKMYGPIPKTFAYRTGGGGYHIWFVAPSGVKVPSSAGRIAPGIDVRSEGGYAITPPSDHASGGTYDLSFKYLDQINGLAVLPDWLSDLATSAAEKSDSPATLESVVVAEGGRNQWLTSAAGFLRDRGLSAPQISPVLGELNRVSCSPPLSDHEVSQVAGSVQRYIPTRSIGNPQDEPFPLAVFPDSVGDFIGRAATAIQCSATMIAAPMLAIMGAAIGTTRCAMVKESWREPPMVWVAVVAESGTKKSPALDVAKGPVEELQIEAEAIYRAEVEKFREWEQKYAGSSEEAPAEPAPMQQFMTIDSTTEAVIALLHRQSRGIVVPCDELSGWFGSLNRYAKGRAGDEAYWLMMFGGRMLKVDRKTTQEQTIVIQRAAVSICGAIPPETLRRAIGEEHMENGLAARLLIVKPTTHPATWTEDDITSEEREVYSRSIRRLYTLQPSEDGSPLDLPLDASAKKVWADFYDRHNRVAQGYSGHLRAVLSKLEGYAIRFALILCHLRWACSEEGTPEPVAITEKDMAGGVCLAEWFKREAIRITSALHLVSEDSRRQELIDYIRQTFPKPFSVAELVRKNDKNKDRDRTAECLNHLVAQGLLETVHTKSPGGGRATIKYQIRASEGAGA